jgi:hypothetical protein
VTLPKVDLGVYISQLSSFEQRVRSDCGGTNNFGMNIELRTRFSAWTTGVATQPKNGTARGLLAQALDYNIHRAHHVPILHRSTECPGCAGCRPSPGPWLHYTWRILHASSNPAQSG